MKYIKIIKLALLTMSITATSFYSNADVKGAMTTATSSVVKFGKDVVDGVGEGIDKGLGKDQPAKNAFINYLVQVLSYKTENGLTRVIVGVKEKNGKPEKIKDLDKKAIYLVDNQDYATPLNTKETTISSVTLPSHAGTKFELVFDQVENPTKLRIFGVDLPIAPHNATNITNTSH